MRFTWPVLTLLLTNIPLNETTNIITEKLFTGSTRFNGFSVYEFRKLFDLTIKNCRFLFNENLFEQVDGVGMGSPLGPIFANIFLSLYASNWLESCPSEFKPLFFRRNVDDCFILFRSRYHIIPFLNYLNSKHSRIQLTHEPGNNKSLSFLDVLINRSGGSFSTAVYRKPTFTGLLTSFDSFIPFTYKKTLIFSLNVLTLAQRTLFLAPDLRNSKAFSFKTLILKISSTVA